MPGKFHDGYTKAAQKEKFVRNRDIKLKESELRQEAKIQKLMCEGICRKCREKVQWRFNFDKYKPLRNIATCQNCKQKTVTKAYRTWCDRCAASKASCPGCCVLLEIANLLAPEAEKADEAVEETEAAEEAVNEPKGATMLAVGDTTAVDDAPDNEATSIDNNNSDDADEEEESIGEGDQAHVQDTDTADAEKLLDSQAIAELETLEGMHWNEKKFVNIATTKYSKTRQIITIGTTVGPAAVDSCEGQEA